ncbi:hypothetical protein I317_01454 [Kwoniella heveanensis CBS 569]|nr:hypothetical protein I317_01454 [Kwoniella heveanensis CBS 569]
MTTNLYAVAGPSKPASIATASSVSPKSEPASPSPLKSVHALPPVPSGAGVQKPGLSLDENGEVLKVPAFLNKLYTMVSDSEVDDLIYWGESGDSFFVPNAEQFGRELLPRWFKHSNFSSFVRQLNMYGFHKVPHLQSGALKYETPVELWEFANPFFKRGQPTLLAKVTRKNNRPGQAPTAPPSTGSSSSNTRSATQAAAFPSSGSASQASQGKYLITDGTVEGEAGPLVGPSGQVLDLGAIQSGIAAIRQTQATIGADLRKLQASNEALWSQALATQEKQRKHEDTINLIVSFLERLFGTEGEGLKGLKEAMRRGGVGRPREDSNPEDGGSAKKRRRMGLDRMISDGKAMDDPDQDDDDRLVEIGSKIGYPLPSFKRSSSGTSSSDPWSSSAQRFTTISTEDEPTPSSLSRGASKTATPGAEQTLGTNHLSPLSDTDHLLPSDNNALARYTAPQSLNLGSDNAANISSNISNSGNNGNTSLDNHGGPPLLSPTSAEAAASAYNLDPSLLQTTIGSLLQSPAAAQMFLNSLNNSAQGQALQSPGPSSLRNSLSNPSSGQFPFNVNTNINNANMNNSVQGINNGGLSNPTQNAGANNGGIDASLDPTMALFSPLPHQDALMQNTDDLLKSYQDALAVNGGVDQLQESIDSLVRSMGLDLPAGTGDATSQGFDGIKMDGHLPQVAGGTGGGGAAAGGEQLVDDFNVDEFFQNLAKNDELADGGISLPGAGTGTGTGTDNGNGLL